MGKGKGGIEGFERVACPRAGINVDPGGFGSPIKSSVDLAASSTVPMSLYLNRHKSEHFQTFPRCQFQA